MSQPFVTVGVPAVVHKLLKDDAAANGGLKQWAMIAAWGRCFRLASPELQTQALRNIEDESIATPLSDSGCGDVRCESASLVSETAFLNQIIADAVHDGIIDASEKRRIRSLCKRVLAKANNTAKLAGV